MKQLFLLILCCLALLLWGRSAQAGVDVSTVTGQKIMFDSNAGITTVEGNAVIQNSTATLKADKIVLDMKSKSGSAQGNVVLVQSSGTLTGTDAVYSWSSGTGTINGATGESDPWRFNAKEMKQIGPDLFALDDASITTCDEVPPHFRFLSRKGTLKKGEWLKLSNARFVPDDTPSFWLPIYKKSLRPKKYRLRIEPGQSSRDGLTNKTTLGYPFTPHTWTNFRWDYLQKTGNGGGLEHVYDTQNIRGIFDSYYIRDSNPDVDIPRSKRYTVLWNHYQKLSQRLTLNSRIDLKSDQSFGSAYSNVGNGVRVENQSRGLLSEGGLTYQLPVVTVQALFDRKDRFDSTVSSHQFISHVTLPHLILNTAPLTGRYFPLYTSFSGSFANDTQDRTDPKQNLYYKKNANVAMELKKDLKFGKKLNVTPVANYNQSWADRVLVSTGVSTEEDQYVGRYTMGVDVRRRFLKSLDTRLGYRYGARNEVNLMTQDIQADDYGVEVNQMTGSFQSRMGRSTLMTLSSGYDYRKEPRSSPGKYKYSSARVLPPSLDLQIEVKKNVNLFFRETYSVFDSRTQTPINTPINTSGELQLGDFSKAVFFSQGFSYSKKSFGEKSQLFLNNKIKFYLTSKWYIDLLLGYRAEGETKLQYQKIHPVERGLRIARDMHCWLLRAEFISRPDRNEASFYIDLKANMRSTKNVFAQKQNSAYSTRNDGPDYGQIFPEPEKASASETPQK